MILNETRGNEKFYWLLYLNLCTPQLHSSLSFQSTSRSSNLEAKHGEIKNFSGCCIQNQKYLLKKKGYKNSTSIFFAPLCAIWLEEWASSLYGPTQQDQQLMVKWHVSDRPKTTGTRLHRTERRGRGQYLLLNIQATLQEILTQQKTRLCR